MGGHFIPIDPFYLESVALSAKELSKADCVLIITDHSCTDYELVGRKAKVIVDTRNAGYDIFGGLKCRN